MKHLLVWMMVSGVISSASAADLLEVYRDAYASDAKLTSARFQMEAGREKGPEGLAGVLPNVALNASTSYNHYDITRPADRPADYNSNSYGVQLTQPLFNMQNLIAAKQGYTAVHIAEAQYANALIDLIQRTSQAYFDVLYAEDTLASVQALKTAANEQLQLAKKSFEVGTVTVTDVNDAQARYDLAIAQEIAAQNDISVKRQALRLITGKEPGALSHLRTGLNIAQPMPANMEEWVTAAERDNVDVQVQTLTLESTRQDLDRARAGHLPTVNLTAGYNRSHTQGSTSSTTESLYNGWSVGLNVSMPLFAGGGIQAKVRESLALEDKARSDLDLARRTAAQNARQSFLGVTNGIAQIKGYEAALVSTKSALESNKLGYQVGMKINIDVLNAQSQVADTQQKLARARYDAILAQLKLKSSVGALSVKDLEDINALLQ